MHVPIAAKVVKTIPLVNNLPSQRVNLTAYQKAYGLVKSATFTARSANKWYMSGIEEVLGQSYLRGTLRVPGSKSVGLRALLIASVAQGTSRIEGLTLCDDVRALVANFATLGVRAEERDGAHYVKGTRWSDGVTLQCGESGLLARVLPFFLVFQGLAGSVAGAGTLRGRAQGALWRALRSTGGRWVAPGARLPLRVRSVQPPPAVACGPADSSQPTTGVLMAMPLARRRGRVSTMGVRSGGYIELTADVMRAFGVEVRQLPGPQVIVVSPHGYSATDYSVEGDWSAAALLLAGLGAGGALRLQGLRRTSAQPDRAIVPILAGCGVQVHWEGNDLLASHVRGSALQPFATDVTDAPDLFPALAVLAAACHGRSYIRGASRLANKESARGEELVRLLCGMGITACIDGDALVVDGGTPHGGDSIQLPQDHRIAMAAALLAMRGVGSTHLVGTSCVGKSYPGFFDDLARLSVRV